MKVGIDSLAIYTPRYALDLATLGKERGIDPDKYYIGLGQQRMAVPPPGEDIITMAANAAERALLGTNSDQIEMLLFATESAVDFSKAAGIYVHDLLQLPSRCRTLELKQACYSGTAAIALALPYLRENPDKKILLIASDIARYGLNTTGESSQGAGAVAMVLSANPRLIAFEKEFGLVTENVMDFWRPIYLQEALVEGKYSSKLYLSMLEKTWAQYQSLSGRHFHDHAYFCYHTPVPRLVEKAHQHLLKLNQQEHLSDELKEKQIAPGLIYGREMGNSYSASLYVSLASLLDHVKEDLSGKRIGFYSYGSGCVAEYFSGIVQPGYAETLKTDFHTQLFSTRKILSYQQYESFFNFEYVKDGSVQEMPVYETGQFHITALKQHKRIYERVASSPSLTVVPTPVIHVANDSHLKPCHPPHLPQRRLGESWDPAIVKVYAPGKLILSGEHAVLYGKPALAMAINRYAVATITEEIAPQILFDLADLAHRSRLSIHSLAQLKERIKNKYHRFIRGEYSIKQVLQKPFELAQVALGVIAESLNLTLPHGVKVHVQSDIPIGCGMGSSAATIISVMHAMTRYLKTSLSPDALYQLALETENMQHGHSSGLDLRMALQGGCLYVSGKEVEERNLPTVPMYLVNTGQPQTTTGQCVEKVAPYFKTGTLGDEFATVTQDLDQALQNNSHKNVTDAIRANHQLLKTIGVVPGKVQQFISQVEVLGGGAKICGAGAVSGDHAGIVLAVGADEGELHELSRAFNYSSFKVTGEARGVYAI